MNVGVRRHVGISLSVYSNNAIVVVKMPIVVLFVEDEMSWVEIVINIWCIVQFARVVEAVEKGVLFDGSFIAKGCILCRYWLPALSLLTM